MQKTVLIAENNTLNMKLLTDLLQVNGYNTISSMNGFNIFQFITKKRPDLILMEVRLGQLSGLDIVEALKKDKQYCNIPIIAVTAVAMPGDKKALLDGGFDEYIEKPISILAILNSIKRHLR